MKPRSIRIRLAAWYSAVLAIALISFGVLSWVALREILLHAAEDTLRDRVEGVRHFMEEQIGSLSVEEIRDEFKEHSVLGPGGDLFQVCDGNGVWLYRSAALENGAVEIRKPSEVPAPGVSEDREVEGTPLRFHSRRVDVLGKPYTIQVATPMHEIREGLDGFATMLMVSIPGVLLLATAGGWWMSRRALEPVGRIIRAARSIGERNLSQRLPEPETEDELQHLSETLNQMLERIEKAFHRITEFTADASHELRTPLALMRTSAELSLRRPRSAEEYRQALEEIQAESVRTTELIENLLTLARADAGKGILERTDLDLSALVREACEQGEKLAHAKGLEFAAEIPSAPVRVPGNRVALRRLLLISLDNAVKYTSEGGVTVRLSNGNGQAVIEVSDTGMGISPVDLPRVFERFYRTDKSRNRDSGGAGLGLSIGKWIVEAHEGSLEARSELERGSTFVITLPGA